MSNTPLEKQAISQRATEIRNDSNNKKIVDTPLKIYGDQISVIIEGSAKGYLNVNEWNRALNQVGIIAPKPTITQTNKTQGAISTATSTSQVVLSIGRTEYTVNSKSIETYNKNTGVKTGTANAMLAMNYHVTENEYLFLREMGDENVEKSLYILVAIIANDGKVTQEILNDKTLSAKGVAMIYHMNYELGMTLAQVDQMYQEEVILPKRAEAWGLLGIRALSGGGLRLQKNTVKGKPVETKTVESPKKPVAGGSGETQGTGNGINRDTIIDSATQAKRVEGLL
ncbi:hypothetical protein R70331_19125 [Paenibacillus sp. FSL R7-0331]|nr:hypothetical protein R70331_19125 [Paenibacillus sp. FSL R7-0331]